MINLKSVSKKGYNAPVGCEHKDNGIAGNGNESHGFHNIEPHTNTPSTDGGWTRFVVQDLVGI
jgi:hypothetical protein